MPSSSTPAFGTGAVKVTPAHDSNDFATGERHGLEKINILNDDGTINANGGRFAGQDRLAARKAVLAALGELGLRRGEKTHRHAVGHCQRCDTVVEPYLSRQWFANVKPLAERALEAVRSGETRLVPDFWVATYENWLENILDWCISRQLWWGHRIPAFYCADGHVTVGEVDPEVCSTCGRPVEQDPDVLDTWFSSALWPISTLGWPDDTADLRVFYPTSTLITGFDILFFWVARMIMMGCHFTGKAPFDTVHLTGLVRDAQRQKMSKTKGNVMDPLDLVHRYGADAVRFTLAALASPGRDLPLDEKRMEGYRAFGTKLWNAARFVQMYLTGEEKPLSELPLEKLALPERWILAELGQTVAAVNRAWEEFRFDEACRQLYQFVWNDFCDWYVELAKPVLTDERGQGTGDGEEPSQPSTFDLRPSTGRLGEDVRAVARGVLLEALKLLHPVMPFITEEIAAHLGHDEMLMTTAYPAARDWPVDEAVLQCVAGVQDVIQEVRSYRHLVGLAPGKPLKLWVLEFPFGFEGAWKPQFERLAAEICRLAALDELSFDEKTVPAGAVRDVAGGVHIAIVLPEGAIGEAERTRLALEHEQVTEELGRLLARLADEGFAARAPQEVVEGARSRAQELEHKAGMLAATLEGR
ncbi:MAG: class I tRNA ligase family protein [Thermoanaerobaculaceae bacterium]